MRKIPIFLSLLVIFSLLSSSAFAYVQNILAYDHDFTQGGGFGQFSYNYVGNNCFANKNWVSTFNGKYGLANFTANISAYTDCQFYILFNTNDAWTAGSKPYLASITYYVSSTTNWAPLARPAFKIINADTLETINQVNLSTTSGWQTASITGNLSNGNPYKLMLDFMTWEDMPPGIVIMVDNVQFGTIEADSGASVVSNPESCVFPSATANLSYDQGFYYMFDNTTLPNAIEDHIGNWSNVANIWVERPNATGTWHWYSYEPGYEHNGLYWIDRGEIVYIITLDNSSFSINDCNPKSCGSFQSGVKYSYPFASQSLPGAFSSYISNFADVKSISAFDGISWSSYFNQNYYSLSSIARGQAFILNTTSGSNYSFGDQGVIGTKCVADATNRKYQTSTDGCEITYGYCPEGTVCSQITPQVNITNTLVENFTDCSMCWFMHSFLNSNVLLWTNCPNNPECECKSTGLCKANSFYTNVSSTPYSVYEYTIGCYNSDTKDVDYIVDQNGNNTTQADLINKSLNGTYNGTIGGTTNIPELPTSVYGRTALMFGSVFGMGSAQYLDQDIAMLSIVIAISLAFCALVIARNSEKAAEAFAYTFIGMLCILTVGLNNLYLWAVFIILAILSAAIMSGALKKIITGE